MERDTTRRILVVNAGSATLKASLVETPRDGSLDADVPREPRSSFSADWSTPGSAAEVRRAIDAALADGLPVSGDPAVDGVGHRVVHGGSRFRDAALVDDGVLADLDVLGHLAPLHNPVAVATMRAARDRVPDAPHVAAFDTAFHASLPEVERRYPLPHAWVSTYGLRRYGFHGLSVAWSVARAAALLDRPLGGLRLVVAHLGGGCSVTATVGDRSLATSMGFTPLEGLMMGTRAGSVDPGVLLHLMRSGMPIDELAAGLEHQSGLLGVSRVSGDLREVRAAASNGGPDAAIAVELFVARAAAGIAAVATALDRVDGLVFTGGIGEHDGAARASIVHRLGVLGLGPGAAGATAIAADGSPDAVLLDGPGPAVLRIAAREDLVIAAATARVLAG